VLGAANLLANWLIAESDPTVRVLLAERMTMLKPVVGMVAAPIVEEVSLRLFLMSAVAWIGWRVTKRVGLAFALALLGSSLFFAALHLDRPLPADPALANYYRAALLVKYTLAGLPLGWIFWRWGLPYAIVCHIAANAVHLALQQRFF
jgi:membrane protease YdiL (CAAX protease family)